MAGNSTESGRSVTSKITSILLTFTEGSEHSLTEIARLAGLPISTAHRLATELTCWRLLERTADGHYHAGRQLRIISDGPDRAATLHERAPCVLEDLAAATRSRARLGVLQELEVAYIEKQPGHHPVTVFTPAATLPAHPTALGRALLAFASPGVVEMTILRGLHPYTAHTITSIDRFRRALAVTRLTRVAVTRYELEVGACGVAMPVFGPGGAVVAAIELTVHTLGTTLQPVLMALAIATRSLSRELVGHPRHRHTGEPTRLPDEFVASCRRVEEHGAVDVAARGPHLPVPVGGDRNREAADVSHAHQAPAHDARTADRTTASSASAGGRLREGR